VRVQTGVSGYDLESVCFVAIYFTFSYFVHKNSGIMRKSIKEVGPEEISEREVVYKLSFVGGQGFRKCNCSKKSRSCVCTNLTIYFVTQNVTTVNLAVTSDFNYDLIMLKEILINKFHLFHKHFLLIHYLNVVKYKTVKFNVILGFV
jgi:hypothetical protein